MEKPPCKTVPSGIHTLDVTDIERVYAEVSNLGYHELEEGIQFLPFWNHGVRFFTIQGPNSEKVEFSQML